MEKKTKKKTTENPIMVNEKKIKGIKISNTSEDENEVKAFLIIIVVIAVLIGIIYGLTELLKNHEDGNVNNVIAGEVNYDIVSVGTLLNRAEKEYYVLAFKSEENDSMLYSALLTKYMQNSSKKDYIKIYYCDLSNSLNRDYYNVNNDGKSNPEATKTEDFNFGNLTLIKVKDGKVNKYIEDYESVKKILSKAS